MGIYDGIGQARAQGIRGIYLEPGEYKLRVEAVKKGTGQDTVEFFVVEFLILESTCPDRPVGSRASWFTKASRHSFLGDLNGFISTSMEVEPGDLEPEVVDMVTSEDQPLVGRDLCAQAHHVTMKNGNPFTKVMFFPAN